MDVRLVTQPFEDGSDLRDFLAEVGADPHFTTMRIAVAWAKRSGISRVLPDLEALRRRPGGSITAIVGVSEGGATRQGLEALMDAVDEAYVFHEAGRTFHPKVYFAEGGERALLLSGSHNLTAGGVAWNHEAGLVCRLDLTGDVDRELRDSVVNYFERLKADSPVCLPLNRELLEALALDASLNIGDEDRGRGPASSSPDRPEDSDSSTDESAARPRAFGKSTQKKRSMPLPVGQGALAGRPSSASKPPAADGSGAVKAGAGHAAPSGAPAPTSTASAPVSKRWFKQMDGTAAQQPPGTGSKPTGNLRLSQEAFAIDHTRYFRDVFFDGLAWAPRAADPRFEDASVDFDVTVDGKPLGKHSLRVSHAPHRISGQGNVPTVLHWRSLGGVLRGTNYVGHNVSLERHADDTYGLTISPAPTGPFLY